MKEYANGQLIVSDTLALITNSNKLDTVNASLTTINTTLGTTNNQLTDVNTNLGTINKSIGTLNTTLTSTNTKLDTVNNNLGALHSDLSDPTTGTNALLSILNTDLYDTSNSQPSLISLLNKYLGANDIPHVALPYNYFTMVKYSASVYSGITVFTFSESDWGSGKSFYPMGIQIEIYLSTQYAGNDFFSSLAVEIYNSASTVKETIFSKTYIPPQLTFVPTSILFLQNPSFETALSSNDWVIDSGSAVRSSTEHYDGSYSLYSNGSVDFIVEQNGLLVPAGLTQVEGFTIVYFTYMTGIPANPIDFIFTLTFDDGSTSTITSELAVSASSWTEQLTSPTYPTSPVGIPKYLTGIKIETSGLSTSGISLYLDDFSAHVTMWNFKINEPIITQNQFLSTDKLAITINNNVNAPSNGGIVTLNALYIYLLGLAI